MFQFDHSQQSILDAIGMTKKQNTAITKAAIARLTKEDDIALTDDEVIALSYAITLTSKDTIHYVLKIFYPQLFTDGNLSIRPSRVIECVANLDRKIVLLLAAITLVKPENLCVPM